VVMLFQKEQAAVIVVVVGSVMVAVMRGVAHPRSSWSSCTLAEFFQNSMEACTPPPRRSWLSETHQNPVSNLEFLRRHPREGPTSTCHPRDICHACPNNTQQSWRCSRQSEERLRNRSEWSCIRPDSLGMCHLVMCHQESRNCRKKLWRLVVGVAQLCTMRPRRLQAQYHPIYSRHFHTRR
jgi:hypothetical protein